MPEKPTTVAQYLKSLPADRRATLTEVRKVILKNLPKGYEEGIQYGMIGYFVPHSIYPDGYHCDPKQPLPFASMASQKNHMALYLMCIYGDEDHRNWFVSEWKKTGLKLDMGKSCVRFKKLEDLPLDLIGKAIKRVKVKDYITFYEDAFKKTSAGKKKAASKKKTATKKKPAASKKKTATAKKRTVKKKTTKKKAGTTSKKKTTKKRTTRKKTTR